ncbi:hypothetical protein BHE74_00050491 [Ensete ventricosum]|nr:hypothetical protein GW17_00024023 [Ensete ventricosum]RWW43800.1 hypothetical protein BHE74_00050491 [Ensete ventricosum]RZS23347.1 hypothetical protein BHM03_00056259 [Ensete ventricosum]
MVHWYRLVFRRRRRRGRGSNNRGGRRGCVGGRRKRKDEGVVIEEEGAYWGLATVNDNDSISSMRLARRGLTFVSSNWCFCIDLYWTGTKQKSSMFSICRMETLKRHLPISVPEGLNELQKIAIRFEEKIYAAASNQVN